MANEDNNDRRRLITGSSRWTQSKLAVKVAEQIERGLEQEEVDKIYIKLYILSYAQSSFCFCDVL